MNLIQSPVPLLIVAAVLAATGQVLFKLGTAGTAATPIGLVNPTIAVALVCYALGTLLWLMALSRTTLMVAYPFTALTFVLVYGAAIFILHERLTVAGAVGSGLVWAGLAVLLWSQVSAG